MSNTFTMTKYGQAPGALMMIRPAAFGFNPQTAESNAFQENINSQPQDLLYQALKEFDHMVAVLETEGVEVVVFDDGPVPQKPDAIFPNNWISFHEDGKVVLYPMLAENRRIERRMDIIEHLRKSFEITAIIDLSKEEKQQRYLEGTGSLVFDHVNRIAYACRSPRTDVALVRELCDTLHYKPVLFDAADERRRPVYHTNVLMSIGSRFAVLCLDAIHNEADQEILLSTLAQTNHKVVAISYEQMRRFSGNMQEVKTRYGDAGVLVSERAFNALLPGQLDAISKFAELIPIRVNTIEDIGGGSVGVWLREYIWGN